MGLLDIFKPSTPVKKERSYKLRRYAGAGSQTAALTGWATNQTSADAEIWSSLQTLIDRSRSLYRDDSNIYTAIEELVSLVVDRGLTLQSKIKLKNGEYNTKLNSEIEDKFNAWARCKTWVTASGTMSFYEAQRVIFRSLIVDGGVLVRLINQPFGGSPVSLAIELLEVDQLDSRMTVAPNGNEIRMGVELDKRWKTPVAYWILDSHPGDYLTARTGQSTRARRVPAGEILHIFTETRPGQTRGIPMIASGIIKSRALLGLEEAEVTKARLQSCIGLVIQNEHPDFEPTKDEYGESIFDLSPGMVEYLEPGQTMTPFDPSSPNVNLPAFVKHFQRNLAGIFGLPAHLVHRDLSEANYSSLRESSLASWRRTTLYRTLLNRDLNLPIYQRWLDAANLSGYISMPPDYEMSKEEKYYCCSFHGKAREWVDPMKDVSAISKQLESGLTTRTQVLAEKGLDYEDILAERAKEIALEKKYKVKWDGDRRSRSLNDDLVVNVALDGQTVSQTRQLP